MSDQPQPTENYLYVGLRLQNKRKVYAYYPIKDQQPDEVLEKEKIIYFKRQIHKGASVGCIYSFNVDPEKNAVYHNGTFISRHPNYDLVVELQAQDKAIREYQTRLKRAEVDLVRETLAPLKGLYKRSSPRIKRLLLAQVIEEINR